MTMAYIRRTYNVPAKRGGRIRFRENMPASKFAGKEGTIKGAREQYLRIRMDDDGRTYTFHPTWEIDYL